MPILPQSRRHFLASASLAAAAGVLGARASLANEGPPETTIVCIAKVASLCLAPQYVAEELLRAEGFAEVQYVAAGPGIDTSKKIASGEVDFSLNFAAPLVISLDAGDPVTLVAGVHSGCFELFGSERVRGIADLKGRSVGVPSFGSGPYLFVASMLTYVGLDPDKDVNWVTSETVKPKELFAAGRIDAFLGFAGAAGAARPQHRPCDPQQCGRPSMVAVLLLSAVGQHGLHP